MDTGIKNNINRGKYPELFEFFDNFYRNFKEGNLDNKSYENLIKIIINDIRKSEKKLKDRRLYTKLVLTVNPFKYLK